MIHNRSNFRKCSGLDLYSSCKFLCYIPDLHLPPSFRSLGEEEDYIVILYVGIAYFVHNGL